MEAEIVSKETIPVYTWVINIAITVFGFIGGMTLKNVWNDMREHKIHLAALDKAQDQFKLHVSEEYEKKGSVQLSLSRIHERMDSIETKIDHNYETISRDIKTLIGRK